MWPSAISPCDAGSPIDCSPQSEKQPRRARIAWRAISRLRIVLRAGLGKCTASRKCPGGEVPVVSSREWFGRLSTDGKARMHINNQAVKTRLVELVLRLWLAIVSSPGGEGRAAGG